MAAAEILRVGSDGAEDEGRRPARRVPPAGGLYDILGGGLGGGAVQPLSSGPGSRRRLQRWLRLPGRRFRLSTGFSLALVGAGYLMGITAGIAIPLIGVVISLGRRGAAADRQQRVADGQSLSDLATQLFAGALPRRRHHRGRAVDPGDPVRADGAGRLGSPLGAVRGNSRCTACAPSWICRWILLIAGILVSLFGGLQPLPRCARRIWPARSSGACGGIAWCSPSSSAS